MKNDYFAFINTSNQAAAVVYEFIDDKGQKQVSIDILPAKDTVSDSTAKSYLKAKFNSKTIELIDVKVASGGASVDSAKSIMRPDAFGTAQEILKKSVILDIETLGREGGKTITQLGLYDVESGSGKMIVAKPQLIKESEFGPDMRFKSRLGSYEAIPKGTTFKDIKYAETLSKMEKISFDESIAKVQSRAFDVDKVEAYLMDTDYFQGRYYASETGLREGLKRRGLSAAKVNEKVAELRPIRNFMQALSSGMTESDIEELFRATRGDTVTLSKLFKGGFELTERSMRSILTEDLPDLLRGKITWIANASFESTQFGAQIDAESKMSLDALNSAREAKGLSIIKERDFVSRFQYGGYEKEISELNVVRATKGEAPLLTKNPMMGVVSGISTSSGKPFYVTGKEFQTARSLAMKTGDFSDLYDVFIKTTGAGDVRDIIDLVRMQQSMLIDQGIITTSAKPSSLSVEVQARLFGVTEKLRKGATVDDAMQRVFEKELHVGIGDVRLSEFPILRESLDQLEALNIVRKGLEGSEELIQEARLGRGAYFRAQVYGELMDRLNVLAVDESGKTVESLQDVLFKQRAGRYALDLAESGSYDFREYSPGFGTVRQAKQVGDIALTETMPIVKSKVTKRLNFNDILEDIAKLDDYPSARKDSLINEVRDYFEGTYDKNTGLIFDDQHAEFIKKARSYSESASSQINVIEKRFRAESGNVLNDIVTTVKKNNYLTRTHVARRLKQSTPASVGNFSSATKSVKQAINKIPSKFKKGYIAAASLFLGASFIPKAEKKKNLFIGSEEDYLEASYKASGYKTSEDFRRALQTRYNGIEGMSESGMAALLRKMTTDFGSPYRSPEYSMSVLDNYNLRRERERYVSEQFGARHFSAEGDVGFFLKSFVSSLFKKQMGTARSSNILLAGGTPLDKGRYNSLRGKNLFEYNLSGSKDITVDDADTITIRNINSSGRNLSVRLAGIDAPEISHKGRAAQPFAEEAKRIATEMISKAKDIRIVTQPDDHTYGRQVAMVYADGINVNLELLKRGAAAYLPYKGKAKPQIYNAKAFEDAQERAYKSKRGMWRESYFQAYKMISDSTNQNVTFNTLVNLPKVATNGNLMSMRSLMDQAQKMGIDNQLGLEIADLGEAIKGSKNPFAPDNIKNSWSDIDMQAYGKNSNSILSVLDRQKYEIGNLMRTRGSDTNSNKHETRRVAQKNVELTSETLAHKSYSKEKEINNNLKYNSQQRKIKRLKTMEYLQHNALRNQFNSPIGHHRM